MEKYLSKTPVVILLATFCCALWGSAFPFVKIGYRLFQIESSATNQIFLFAGVRFFLSGVMVLLVSCFMNRKFPLIKGPLMWRQILALAAVQTVLQYIFFYIGLANTTGSKASIVEAMNVFFSVLLSALVYRMEKLSLLKILGCIVGFFGVVLVNLGSKGTTAFNLTGDGFILISTVAYAFSAVMIKRYAKDHDPVTMSGYQFVIGGAILAALGYGMGGRIQILSLEALVVLLYLAFISAAAYTLWGLLLKYNTVSKVSVYGFANPMFGVLLSAILLQEHQSLGIRFFLALLLVCTGIVMVNMTRKKTA